MLLISPNTIHTALTLRNGESYNQIATDLATRVSADFAGMFKDSLDSSVKTLMFKTSDYPSLCLGDSLELVLPVPFIKVDANFSVSYCSDANGSDPIAITDYFYNESSQILAVYEVYEYVMVTFTAGLTIPVEPTAEQVYTDVPDEIKYMLIDLARIHYKKQSASPEDLHSISQSEYVLKESFKELLPDPRNKIRPL